MRSRTQRFCYAYYTSCIVLFCNLKKKIEKEKKMLLLFSIRVAEWPPTWERASWFNVHVFCDRL